MPVTPFEPNEIPNYRRGSVNSNMQGFVDKFTVVTIPELNALGITSPSQTYSPQLMGGGLTFDVAGTDEKRLRTYIGNETTTSVLTFSNGDNHFNLTTGANVISGGSFVVQPKSKVTVWWESVGPDSNIKFFDSMAGSFSLRIANSSKSTPLLT